MQQPGAGVAALRDASGNLTLSEAALEPRPGATVRPDQLAAATALACEGRRALVVQATGWGKSAVYWMATRALRDWNS